MSMKVIPMTPTIPLVINMTKRIEILSIKVQEKDQHLIFKVKVRFLIYQTIVLLIQVLREAVCRNLIKLKIESMKLLIYASNKIMPLKENSLM
jgi:hypothetical protein